MQSLAVLLDSPRLRIAEFLKANPAHQHHTFTPFYVARCISVYLGLFGRRRQLGYIEGVEAGAGAWRCICMEKVFFGLFGFGDFCGVKM